MYQFYRTIKSILLHGGMAEGEASAIAFLLLEEQTGLTKAQILTTDTPPADTDRLLTLAQKVAEGFPIQYALGISDFCGLKFHVEPGVLIPRPETEELVDWVVSSCPSDQQRRILDIGTGSGCIAVTLAKRLPHAQVTACDISPVALRVAAQNADRHGVEVRFQHTDILTETPQGTYDVVVSNPPYICNSEARQMQRNVLDHEPHLALFVPDATPLLFYEAIARKSLQLLSPGGFLFFEINRQYGTAVTSLLRSLGYTDVELRQDQFGNDRMVRGVKS